MKDSYMKDRLEGIYDKKIRDLEELTTKKQKFLRNDARKQMELIKENPPDLLTVLYGYLKRGHSCCSVSSIVEELPAAQGVIREYEADNKLLIEVREEVKAILRDKFDRLYDQYMYNNSACLHFICNGNNITVSALVDYAFEKREEK